MKITASHSIKIPHPDPAIEFGSVGASVCIEGTPPESMTKEQLTEYTRRLLAEAKARAEEHLAHEGEKDSGREEPQPQELPRAPHRPMAAPNGRSNGRARGGTQASPKQVNFIRSLGTQAGFSYDDLGYMAEEAFGKRDIRSLTKREASALIDDLRNGEGR